MDVNERVATLERTVRRLTAALGAAGVLAVALAAMGAVKPAPDSIEARKFIVVGDDGKPYAVLGRENELTGVSVWDGRRKIRMMLGVDPDGASFINCCDASGRSVLDLYVDRDGTPLIEIKDRAGKVAWTAP